MGFTETISIVETIQPCVSISCVCVCVPMFDLNLIMMFTRIQHMIESGIPQKWIRNLIRNRENGVELLNMYDDMETRDNNPTEQTGDAKRLNINELFSVFILLALGNGLSSLIFIVELFFYQFYRKSGYRLSWYIFYRKCTKKKLGKIFKSSFY